LIPTSPLAGDYDLSWRVQRAGYELVFDPEAVVWHKHRSKIQELIKQFFKYGKHQPLLLKKQSGGFSYIRIKTHVFPKYELRCRVPMRVLVTVDLCNLLIFCLIMIVASSVFLYLSLPVFCIIVFGALRTAPGIVQQAEELKWFMLFPFFHFIRNYAFMFGRICGGIKYRVLSI